MKKTCFAIIVCVSLIVLLVISLFFYMKGSREEKTATNVAFVPIVNSYLSEFPFTGEIKFIYKKYHRGESVLFTSKANLKDVQLFCEEHGWYISDAKDRKSIGSITSEYETSSDIFPLRFGEDDLVIEKPKGKNTTVLIINFISGENKVTGYAINNY